MNTQHSDKYDLPIPFEPAFHISACNSRAHSHAYFISTCAHTDPYTVVEADANSKI